jgi:hypothetical protein
MNKFEKLIEYIINDEDQKARDLFHTIVVEKSRDIYESIMDEEQVEENFGGPVAGEQVEELTNQLADEEAVGEADEEGEQEFDLNPDGEDDDEMGGDLPAEVGHDEEAEEDKIMNIDAKLDELLAKFDEIMGDEGSAEEMSAEMPAMDDMDDMGAEEPKMAEMGMMEADESDDEEDEDEPKDKEEDKKEEAKESRDNSRKLSTSELMREYVDRIGDIYGGAGDAAEGDAVAGSGKKTSVNTKSVTGPGADFGGTAVKSKGSESNPDGTSAPSSEKPQEIKSGNINVPGGKAGSSFKTKEAAKSGEGQTTDGSVPTNDKSPVRK